jgi:hypothetical protein
MKISLLIFFTSLLFVQSKPTLKFGKYKARIEFPQHSFSEIISIKRNGTFKINRTATTVNPSSISSGKWNKSNDTLFLVYRKIVINKKSDAEKRTIYCNVGEFNELMNCFKKDTLIMKSDKLFHLGWNEMFEKR